MPPRLPHAALRPPRHLRPAFLRPLPLPLPLLPETRPYRAPAPSPLTGLLSNVSLFLSPLSCLVS